MSVVKKSDGIVKSPEHGYEGVPISLILDGKVQDTHLEIINKSRQWLEEKLRERGIRSFEDVFFCNIDESGHLFIEKMEESTYQKNQK